MIILGKLKRERKRVFSSFWTWNFDKPVVSHDKLGATDHSSVDQDALFEPILSTWGLSPIGYILLVIVFIKKINNIKDKIKFIAKIHLSVYRTSLQLQIDDYINSTSIKQLDLIPHMTYFH